MRFLLFSLLAISLILLVSCKGGSTTTSNEQKITALISTTAPTNLYEIELKSKGAQISYGEVRKSNGQTLFLTDMAECPNGRLYGITFTDLYQINLNTSEASFIRSNGQSANSLACNNNNQLAVGAVSSGIISILNSETQAVIQTISLVNRSLSGDLAYKDDTLYSIANNGSTDALVRINVSTGENSFITNIAKDKIYGIAFKNGILYGFTESGEIITINQVNGSTTLIRELPLAFSGAAF